MNKGCFKKKYNVDEDYFSTLNDEVCWLLGLLAADGWIKNNTVNISQSNDHGLRMIEHIKSSVNYNGKIYHGRNAHRLTISTKRWVETLEKYNIIERKTLTYQFPKLSKDLERSFLRGYFEGDGSLGVYDNGSGVKTLILSMVGTKDFIEAIENKFPIDGKKTHIKRCENLYELRWNGKKAITVAKWLFEDESLYQSKKVRIYKEYIESRNDRETKYRPLKIKAWQLFNKGMSRWKISKELKVPFQTIYTWIK